MVYLRILLPLYLVRGNSFQDIREEEALCFVLENVGNFQIGYKDSIVVLTL